MVKKVIKLKSDETFITLGVVLKLAGIIDTGGQAKFFLNSNDVFVNNEKENRRGRKLYHDDQIKVLDNLFVID